MLGPTWIFPSLTTITFDKRHKIIWHLRVFDLIPLLLIAVICIQCRNRSAPKLASADLHSAWDLANSVGVITNEFGGDANQIPHQSDSWGSGFLIYKQGGEAIGITARHVWDGLCRSKSCWIAFPKNEAHDQWQYIAIEAYIFEQKAVESDSISASLKNFPGDFYAFKISNPPANLQALKISTEAIKPDLIVHAVGYPSKTIRSCGNTEPEKIPPYLARAQGAITWNNSNRALISALIAAGSSGGPLLAIPKKAKSIAAEGVVVGILINHSINSNSVEIGNQSSTFKMLSQGQRALGFVNLLAQVVKIFPRIPAFTEKLPKKTQDSFATFGKLQDHITDWIVTKGTDESSNVKFTVSPSIGKLSDVYLNGAAITEYINFTSSKVGDRTLINLTVNKDQSDLFSIIEWLPDMSSGSVMFCGTSMGSACYETETFPKSLLSSSWRAGLSQ